MRDPNESSGRRITGLPESSSGSARSNPLVQAGQNRGFDCAKRTGKLLQTGWSQRAKFIRPRAWAGLRRPTFAAPTDRKSRLTRVALFLLPLLAPELRRQPLVARARSTSGCPAGSARPAEPSWPPTSARRRPPAPKRLLVACRSRSDAAGMNELEMLGPRLAKAPALSARSELARSGAPKRPVFRPLAQRLRDDRPASGRTNRASRLAASGFPVRSRNLTSASAELADDAPNRAP